MRDVTLTSVSDGGYTQHSASLRSPPQYIAAAQGWLVLRVQGLQTPVATATAVRSAVLAGWLADLAINPAAVAATLSLPFGAS